MLQSAEGPFRPEPAPITDAEISEYIVQRLGKHADRNDLLFELCQNLGLTWNQADAFVQQVEDQNRSRIALRQSPILLLFAVGTFIGGVWLLFNSSMFFFHLAQTQSLDLIALQRSYRMVLALGTGLAMLAGSTIGFWQTIRTILAK